MKYNDIFIEYLLSISVSCSMIVQSRLREGERERVSTSESGRVKVRV